MTFVPAPPKKFVDIDDLVVGQEYWIDSGLGGVHTVVYTGYYVAGYHKFKNTNDEWPSFILAPAKIIDTVRICHGVMTENDWREAGGKFHDER